MPLLKSDKAYWCAEPLMMYYSWLWRAQGRACRLGPPGGRARPCLGKDHQGHWRIGGRGEYCLGGAGQRTRSALACLHARRRSRHSALEVYINAQHPANPSAADQAVFVFPQAGDIQPSCVCLISLKINRVSKCTSTSRANARSHPTESLLRMKV